MTHASYPQAFTLSSLERALLRRLALGDTPEDTARAADLPLSAAGTLYGTSENGGPNASGSLFTLNADGTGYQTLYAFSAADSAQTNADGTLPTGALLEGSGGTLYGEAQYGGTNADGVVYSLNPDGSGFTALHMFGTAPGGGAYTDGSFPVGGLIRGSDGALYGVTSNGGAADTGTVFTLKPDGTGYTVLHEFSGVDSASVNTGGAVPSASLTLGTDGLLYGVTATGGADGGGVVFRLSRDGTGFTVLHEFSGADDGNFPAAALVKDRAGNLYGTTAAGGSAGQGVLFQLQAGGTGFAPAYALQSGDGTSAALVEGSSGLVYGTTADGGVYSAGELFQVVVSHLSVHLLWDNANGAASLWNYSPNGGLFAQNTYGPYTGWTAKAVADGPDGDTRVLWTNTDGRLSVWSLDNMTGSFTQNTFGPYPGWIATAVSAGPDNTAHILWNNTDGTASVWNYSTESGTFTEHHYGPYAGWTAKTIADGPDGLSRVLWKNTSAQFSLWNLDDGTGLFTHFEYGAYPGWTAVSLSAGF
jgi:uncharacterized repeat protein (TIGR03803 family)